MFIVILESFYAPVNEKAGRMAKDLFDCQIHFQIEFLARKQFVF